VKRLFKIIYHICFYVTDIQKTLAFYETCGFRVKRIMQVTPEDAPWNYLLEINEGQCLELQPVGVKRPFDAPELPTYRKDSCYAHFALLSENIRETVRYLNSRGIPVYATPDGGEPIQEDQLLQDDTWRWGWLIDPDGNPIEIMQEL